MVEATEGDAHRPYTDQEIMDCTFIGYCSPPRDAERTYNITGLAVEYRYPEGMTAESLQQELYSHPYAAGRDTRRRDATRFLWRCMRDCPETLLECGLSRAVIDRLQFKIDTLPFRSYCNDFMLNERDIEALLTHRDNTYHSPLPSEEDLAALYEDYEELCVQRYNALWHLNGNDGSPESNMHRLRVPREEASSALIGIVSAEPVDDVNFFVNARPAAMYGSYNPAWVDYLDETYGTGFDWIQCPENLVKNCAKVYPELVPGSKRYEELYREWKSSDLNPENNVGGPPPFP